MASRKGKGANHRGDDGDTSKIGTADQRRIAAALTNLGWTREKNKDCWWSKT